MKKHYLTGLTALCVFAISTVCVRAGNPVEAGIVEWQRDFDRALEMSAETGRPVFLLFQEIPGCAGCQKFGRDVLSNGLLVEAIENEFIPLLVYNNRSGGKDSELLKQFNEPSWNYQVVRFLDAQGDDLIPRKDRVWSIEGIAGRMIEALKTAKRPTPLYLKVLATEQNTSDHAEIAFAMSCFWTGEQKLGQLEGVISTEAGWLEHREVVKVTYNKDATDPEQLSAQAKELQCAQKTYRPRGQETKGASKEFGILDARYRKADSSDQKKQLSRWQKIYTVPELTPMQLTKINAYAPVDRGKALEWLSPRQRKAILTSE